MMKAGKFINERQKSGLQNGVLDASLSSFEKAYCIKAVHGTRGCKKEISQRDS